MITVIAAMAGRPRLRCGAGATARACAVERRTHCAARRSRGDAAGVRKPRPPARTAARAARGLGAGARRRRGASAGPEPAAAVAATPADGVAGPGGASSRASAFNPAMSVVLTGTYANLSQDPEDYAIAGFFPGGDEIGPGERSFSLGESEIRSPRASTRISPGASPRPLTGEGELEVEEAFARTTALPAGLTLKGGRFFSGIGYLNEVHAHAWDFVDQPLAYQAFFGGQLAQDGVQVKWLAPTDLFLEFGAEAGNGEAFPGTRSGGNDFGTYAVFAHVGGDVGDSIGWRAGLSWVDADPAERAYEDTDALGNAVVNAFTRPVAHVDRRRDLQVVAGRRRTPPCAQAAGRVHAPRRGRAACVRRRRRRARRQLRQPAGRVVRAGGLPFRAALACRPALRRARLRRPAHRSRARRDALIRGLPAARAGDAVARHG